MNSWRLKRLTVGAVLLAMGALATDFDALQAAELTLSHTSGFYSSAFELSFRGGSPVRYTLNGELPTSTSPLAQSLSIRIEATAVLRCAAFDDSGGRISSVVTRTFLFPGAVLNQTGAGFPKTWGTNQGKAVPADYEVDPEIVRDAAYRDDFLRGLTNIPSLAIVMDAADLFDPARGIYANPMKSGDDWERPAAVSYFHSPAGEPIEVDCGIRIQGGWNRRPEESPKHAFRLAFRKKYGAGELKAFLFDEPGPHEFDGLILRAGCNNTWLHWSGVERGHGDYLRDQWMRDTYAAMGRPSARGRFVHLYLNGLYWGVYNLAERPDEHFAAEHFGGKAKDYDARNADNILSGDEIAWKELLALANGGLSNAAPYEVIGRLIDLPAFADFMIVNLYGGNADWDRASNWYAARRRQPPGPFHFFVWDGERTLESADANTLAQDDDQSPLRLFQRLRENAGFRKLFSERVRLHCVNDGALAPKAAADRFQRLSQQLELAIVGESARWGDYRRDAHSYKTGPYELYTRNGHWRPEVERLLAEFFPKRTDVLLKQFRAAGLSPESDK